MGEGRAPLKALAISPTTPDQHRRYRFLIILHTHMHTHMNTHTYTHTHTHIHTYTETHTHMRTHAHTYTHMHTHTHIYRNAHTHIHTHGFLNYTYMHTDIQTCTPGQYTGYTNYSGRPETACKFFRVSQNCFKIFRVL